MGYNEEVEMYCQKHQLRYKVINNYGGDPVPPDHPSWQPHFGKLIRQTGGCPKCGIRTVEQPKAGGCFIATAACGSEDAIEVISLLHFRDTVLNSSKLGQMFVRTYYHFSPPIANFVDKNQLFCRTIRLALIKPVASLYRILFKPDLSIVRSKKQEGDRHELG